ncbi:MAG: hypothetical protein U0271_24565 [Polyangiaceae bacterium]
MNVRYDDYFFERPVVAFLLCLSGAIVSALDKREKIDPSVQPPPKPQRVWPLGWYLGLVLALLVPVPVWILGGALRIWAYGF